MSNHNQTTTSSSSSRRILHPSDVHNHNETALNHLKSVLRPNDGFSISLETATTTSNDNNNMPTSILRRRNIPLTNTSSSSNSNQKNNRNNKYICIYYDVAQSGHIVGIPIDSLEFVDDDNDTIICSKADILVDCHGKIMSKNNTISVVLLKNAKSNNRNYDLNMDWVKDAVTWSQQMMDMTVQHPMIQNIVGNLSNNVHQNDNNDSDHLYAYYAILLLFAAVIIKVMVAFIMSFAFIMLVPVGIVLYCTCPSAANFDAKKELKRVLRGAHLPESHPEKPKGWLEKTAAKITASVTAELVTAAAGYEVEITTFFGGFALMNLARIQVPTSNVVFYFVGCLNTWSYIMQQPLHNN